MPQIQLKLNQFKKIRSSIAILIYKCTIFPVIEYAGFIQDQGIICIYKALQKLQNQGLLIPHNQHILPDDQRDSSETLHRNSLIITIHSLKAHFIDVWLNEIISLPSYLAILMARTVMYENF